MKLPKVNSTFFNVSFKILNLQARAIKFKIDVFFFYIKTIAVSAFKLIVN